MIRKLTFVAMAILVFISSSFGVSRALAKARLTDFEEVDAYISMKMKELGIPGAFALVWRLLRTGIVISTLRQAFERQKKLQPSRSAI